MLVGRFSIVYETLVLAASCLPCRSDEIVSVYEPGNGKRIGLALATPDALVVAVAVSVLTPSDSENVTDAPSTISDGSVTSLSCALKPAGWPHGTLVAPV